MPSGSSTVALSVPWLIGRSVSPRSTAGTIIVAKVGRARARPGRGLPSGGHGDVGAAGPAVVRTGDEPQSSSAMISACARSPSTSVHHSCHTTKPAEQHAGGHRGARRSRRSARRPAAWARGPAGAPRVTRAHAARAALIAIGKTSRARGRHRPAARRAIRRPRRPSGTLAWVQTAALVRGEVQAVAVVAVPAEAAPGRPTRGSLDAFGDSSATPRSSPGRRPPVTL